MSANSAPTFDIDQLPMLPSAGASAPASPQMGGRRRKTGRRVKSAGKRKSNGMRKTGRRRRTGRRMRYN
jgi:hypothetical protein